MTDEVDSETIQKTQKILGKYVKKPQLTEKLLKKPPFRFLHDVVVSVIRNTGFLSGLFTIDELNSENVKDKDAKIAFLNKLIEAIRTITKVDLKVQPKKIIAGLEVTQTNILLQVIGKALDKNLDSSSYVKELRGGGKTTVDKNESSTKIKSNKSKKEEKNVTKRSVDRPKQTTEQNKRNQNVERKSKESARTTLQTSNRSRNNTQKENSKKEEKIVSENEVKLSKDIENKSAEQANEVNANEHMDSKIENNNEEKTAINEEEPESKEVTPSVVSVKATEENSTTENETNGQKIISRPKSIKIKQIDLKEDVTLNNLHSGGDNLENNVIKEHFQVRPKSSLRPPSVRPSSARPGAPRLRPDSTIPPHELVTLGKINVIVDNYDKDAEEETVIIQTTAEIENKYSEVEVVTGENSGNQGHLVEQILEQINDEPAAPRHKVEIDWEEGLRGKDAMMKDMSQLKSLVQNLTRTANPLGKLLNYLNEDIEVMHAELQMWISTKQQLFADIAKQKKNLNGYEPTAAGPTGPFESRNQKTRTASHHYEKQYI